MAVTMHTPTASERTSEVLGGAKVLGVKVTRRLDFVPLLRRGFPWESFERAIRALDLTLEEAGASLRVPTRTLARRKRGAERLAPEESERLLGLASVSARAQQVFGSPEKARRWLRSPSRAFGGVTPLSLLDTDVGAHAVEDELVRIEYGVHA
jgi:putative toxin-antitoxin system antitoxin component (TIGR02293 family)